MFKTLVCGTGNFQQEEEEDLWRSKSLRSHNHHHSKSKNSKNPYSNRGLDKFANVLAELDEKRRQIYDQLHSPDASLVRFGYSSSKDWVPIVVKLKEQKENKNKNISKEKEKTAAMIKKSEVAKKPEIESVESDKLVQVVESKTKTKTKTTTTRKMRRSLVSSMVKWTKPQQCLLVVIILILLCLVFAGKSFAILCTSIWWYLLPTIKENALKQSEKKKNYGRFLSEKKMANEATSKPAMVVKSFKRGYSNKNW